MISKKNNSGFTLIELLVVISIIGVLSGVVLQSLNSARAKSRNATRLTQIDQINKALELSATGGTNKLPYSNGMYVCLGLAGTGSTGESCNSQGDNTTDAVSTIVAQNMAGYSSGSLANIPKDPSLISGIGTRYLYHSNITPIENGNCTATTCPNGAYLVWVVENSTSCGRGIHWLNEAGGITGNSGCVLRIGNAVTN